MQAPFRQLSGMERPELVKLWNSIKEDEQNHLKILRSELIKEVKVNTSEFYTWGAKITKRLVTEKGFAFVAAEGDWPDCYRVNRYIKNKVNPGSSAYEVLYSFNCWPTWMWANKEIVSLVEWLRTYNNKDGAKIGFYGLDVYSLWEGQWELEPRTL